MAAYHFCLLITRARECMNEMPSTGSDRALRKGRRCDFPMAILAEIRAKVYYVCTYRARDRGGAASVPRRRRDVDYMLSSGRPRIFVGWCLLDRHEKGIASFGVATLAELRRPQPLSGSTCTLWKYSAFLRLLVPLECRSSR